MSNIPQDIQELGNRIKNFKNTNQKTSKSSDKPFIHAYQLGSRITVELISGVLVGAGLGYFLDKIFETAPMMLIILLIFGGAAGFLNVYKFVKNYKEE